MPNHPKSTPAIIELQGDKPQKNIGKSGRLAFLFQSSLTADVLCCLPLAVGSAMATLAPTAMPSGLLACLWPACAALFLLLLFRLRLWVAPATLGAGLVIGLPVLFFTGKLGDAWEYVVSFVRWLAAGAPAVLPHSTDGSVFFLQALLVAGITALCFLIIRRLFFFPLVLGLATGILIFCAITYPADYTLATCLCAAAIILMLPRVYARHVARDTADSAAEENTTAKAVLPSGGNGAASTVTAKGTATKTPVRHARRHPRRNTRATSQPERAKMQLVAVPIVLLAVVLSFFIVPQDTAGWQSRSLVNLVADIQYLLSGERGNWPRSASNFSLASLGFQPEETRLGGPVELSDEVILTVSGPRPMLLRGSVRDQYTGEGWQVGAPDGDMRYRSLFMRGYRNTALDEGYPLGGPEARKLYEKLTAEARYMTRTHTGRYSAIFSAWRVTSLDVEEQLRDQEFYFNMRGEVYMHSRLPARTTLVSTARVWMREAGFFEEDFLQLEALAAKAQDTQYEATYARHTQLPDALPDAVRQTALDITTGADSPWQKAQAIAAWLAENCHYTLTPDSLPAGEDFVGYFLQTQEGYCTYYASAMAVLARCVGIPSRYVQGFALERQDAGHYLATGETAHAWAEVYLSGLGWVEIDPLQWDSGNPLNSDVPPEEEPADPTPPTPAPGNQTPNWGLEPPPGEPVDETQENSWLVLLWVLLVPVLLALCLRFGYLYVLGSKRRRYSPARLAARYPNRGDRLDALYRDMLHQFALLGLHYRPGETLSAFRERVDRRISLDNASFAPIADILSRLYFANEEPDDADIRYAADYHRRVEDQVQAVMEPGPYFFRRAIIP